MNEKLFDLDVQVEKVSEANSIWYTRYDSCDTCDLSVRSNCEFCDTSYC